MKNIVELRGESSRVANDILELVPNTNQRSINQPNDLLNIDSNQNKVVIRVTATDVEQITPFLEELGFEVLGAEPDYHYIEGWIPISSLPDLESLSVEGLLGVLPVYQPVNNVGSVTSQADGVHQADRLRAELGIDGAGITIGVMSDSYNNLGGAASDIATGDLPSDGVNVLQDLRRGGSDEGRAMLQLIHDLAPDADLAFSSVFFGELDFAQQIRDLANPELGDADVLVDDIFYLSEPFFQDGVVAQAIDEVVTNEGVTYFSAAGNSGDQSYESTNFAAAPDSAGFFSDTFHDFDPGSGVDTRQRITISSFGSISFSLQWDDPFYTTAGVDTDLGLFLLEAGTNNVVASSNFDNIASQTPFEILNFTNPSFSSQQYDVLITLGEGPEPGRIKYSNFGFDVIFNEFGTNSSTVVGHPSATNAQAVAASPFFEPTNPESFTSVGPSTILFEPDGTRTTPEIRQTPDITAVDGTNTTFFGQDIANDSDSFPNFFGTSAAAPHAAAIAALIQQADPSLTPQEVYDVLAATATDIAESGFDNVTGAGLIDAFNAVSSILPDNTPPVAVDDAVTTQANTVATIPIADLLANDTDADRDTLTLESLDNAVNGSVEIDGENVIFTPDADFNGDASFEYTISDGNGGEDTATVEVTVNPATEGENIRGTAENDTLSGGAGNDTIIGRAGNDVIDGADGNDSLIGSRGNDILSGGSKDDELFGNGNNDLLNGEEGHDYLFGGVGNDTIRGGFGNDTLEGNAGRDVFVLAVGEGTDTIEDFQLKKDTIGLAEGLTFAELTLFGNEIVFDGEILTTLNIAADSLTESNFTPV